MAGNKPDYMGIWKQISSGDVGFFFLRFNGKHRENWTRGTIQDSLGVAQIQRLQRDGTVYAFKKVYEPTSAANSASDRPLVYIASTSKGLVISGDYYLTEMPGNPAGTFVMEPYRGGPVINALLESILSANDRRQEPLGVVDRKRRLKGRAPRFKHPKLRDRLPPPTR